MFMRNEVNIVIALCIFSFSLSAHEILIFEDNFENYSIGTLPLGWTIVWNGRGDQAQIVTAEYSASGTRSFRLWGQPGWSAVVQREFSSDAQVIGYEFKILIEERGLSGQEHPAFFKYGAEGNVWGTYYAAVIFDHTDGKIKGENDVVLGGWEPKKWYTVKVILNRQTKTYDVWINGTLCGSALPIKAKHPELINALALTSAHAGQKVFYDDVKVFYVSGSPPSLADWTVLIYANADNNLEVPILRAINKIEKVGSTDRVHVLALVDRIKGYDTSDGDWDDTRLYYLRQDKDETKINSVLLYGGTEQDMGSVLTLHDFVINAIREYPAKHYLLLILAHGDRWFISPDDTTKEKTKSESFMTALDFGSAIKSISAFIGKPIDIVFLFTCTNAMIEVLIETAGYVEYVIASETLISVGRLPLIEYFDLRMQWDRWMQRLVENPHWTAQKVVDTIFEAIDLPIGIKEMVFTAFKGETLYWSNLRRHVARLARLLIEVLPSHRQALWDARWKTYEVKDPILGTGCVDLYHLCQRIAETMKEKGDLRFESIFTDISRELTAVTEKIKSTVWIAPVKGLTIYFPLEYPGNDAWASYQTQLLARATDWDEFLYKWWFEEETKRQHEFTYGVAGWYLVSVPTIGDKAKLFGRLYFWNGNTYDVLQGDDPILPTRGYWAYLGERHTIKTLGEIPQADQTVDLPVTGWHLISVPWGLNKIDILVKRHGEIKSWPEAVSAGWVANHIWGYEPKQGYFSAATLSPWYGYWVKSTMDSIVLVFPYSKRVDTQNTLFDAKNTLLEDEPPEVPDWMFLDKLDFIAQSSYYSTYTDTITFKVLGSLPILGIKISVYDLTGRLVWEGTSYSSELIWNKTDFCGTRLANGVYLYKICARLMSGDWICSEVRKIAILR